MYERQMTTRELIDEKINYEHSGMNLTIHDLIPTKPIALNTASAIEAIRNEMAKARGRVDLLRYQREAVPVYTEFVIQARRYENGEIGSDELLREYQKAYNTLNDIRYYEN